ncbi:cupin domain-containing protein [Pontimicrobium sp. IMCC45349]|uniref:cupin domain-containing protein n=1 Tax=Pontimicrobium sp. IMCC45349 TaxID=3391574 RepID=UPI0039A15237
MNNTIKTNKKTVIRKASDTFKYWMTDKEFTGILVGKEATNSEYVISDGLIEPGGFVPDHYHKWEDQTFHIQQGTLEAKIGDEIMIVEAGDAIHCPKGVSHYMKNIGEEDVKMVSYIFPGDWAEDFFIETSKQVKSNKKDLELIEEKFGVVYL